MQKLLKQLKSMSKIFTEAADTLNGLSEEIKNNPNMEDKEANDLLAKFMAEMILIDMKMRSIAEKED